MPTKQQYLSLLSLKQIHTIAISSTPYRTLNSNREIIRYKDDDLYNLTDDEISAELAHQRDTDVKRLKSKNNGQEIKLNTFLLTFHVHTVLSSIRMSLYSIKVSQYAPNPIP